MRSFATYVWISLVIAPPASASPLFTKAGDGQFRNLTATGGAITGVDVSGAIVQQNGGAETLATLAAQIVPLSAANQPNGWAQLDAAGTLSQALVAAAWTGAVQRSIAARASDVLNVKDFGALGNGVHDDTAAIQTALNLATALNLGWRVEIPPGHYILDATLTARLTGNNGLHVHGSGSGETMLEWQIPATATNQDGLDITAGGIALNTPFRQQPLVAGQFVKIEGLTFVANGYASHPAGNGVSVVASYNSATPSTLPFGTIDDVAFVGGGHSLPITNGPNSGYDAWLNGVYLKGVQNVTIDGMAVYPPQLTSCSNGSNEAGMTASCSWVAGAGILLDADKFNYADQTQGVAVSGLDIKGYEAGFAESGFTQGDGVTKSNFFGDEYAVVLGGGVILDQDSGPPVATTAFGYGGDYGFWVPNTTGLSPGQSIVLTGAANAIPGGASIASIGTAPDANGFGYRITWAVPGTQNTTTWAGDTCSFVSGSTKVTATCSGSMGAHGVTVSSASGTIVNGMSVADTTNAANVPSGEAVTNVSGATISFGKAGGQNNYTFGTANGSTATGVAVSFTGGLALTTPYGSGGFSFEDSACDVRQSCLYAPADPSGIGYGGVTMHDIGIIANDAASNEVIVQLGNSAGNTIYDNNATSGGGGTQQFLVQTGEPTGSTQGTIVYDNQVNTQGSTAPQIVLANAPNSAVYGNTIAGSSPLGTDNVPADFWGLNHWNGTTQLGLTGGVMIGASAPIGLSATTVAALPASCTPGEIAYATDGRKAAEAAGGGSGVAVLCTLSAVGGSDQWWSLWSSAQVQH